MLHETEQSEKAAAWPSELIGLYVFKMHKMHNPGNPPKTPILPTQPKTPHPPRTNITPGEKTGVT